MKNKGIASLLREISHYLEMENGGFKSRAYDRAARLLDNMERDISSVYEEGGREALEELEGIGEGLSSKIREALTKGRIGYLEKLRERKPLKLEELVRVQGLGPKRIKKLYKEIGVANLEELEVAARDKKIQEVEGFGEKSQTNILESIEFLKSSKGRYILGEVLPYVRKLEESLRDLDQVEKVSLVGSARRGRATVGDIDILVGAEDGREVMSFFVSQPDVTKVWGKGETKSSIRVRSGLNIDLRVVPPSSYGAALQYFTGSMEHNIATRQIAKRRGMKLNEYGLYRGEERIAGEIEESIYSELGLDWIPPEIRENEGEIEASQQGILPDLVEGVRGDLHLHTDWSDGLSSIEEMVEKADELGYEYIGISDHSYFFKDRILEQKKAIKSRKVLHGLEVNILKDGSLDIEDEILKTLDYVIAGIHSLGSGDMTERVVRAIRHPQVNIIAHPTTRILKKRGEVGLDMDVILKEARENKVALEINARPKRLDLKGELVRRAKNKGVKMMIGSDSHRKGEMGNIRLGILQARRGWAEDEDIINTWSLERVLNFFDK